MSNVIDGEVLDVEVEWEEKPSTPNGKSPKATNTDTPKGLAGVVKRHVENLSPEQRSKVKTLARKGGIVGLTSYAASLIVPTVTDSFAGEGDNNWACKPPADGRTLYYPVTGNGNYDDVSGVDGLDTDTDQLNAALFGYEPEDVRSFHDAPCLHGCVQTITEPASLTTDLADTFFSDVHDAYRNTATALDHAADEQWVQALIEKRYGSGTEFDLAALQDTVQSISTAAGEMLGSSNAAAVTGHKLLRDTIRKTRADLAAGYTDGESGFSWAATSAGAATGLRAGIVGAGVGALGAGLVSGLWSDRFPEDVADALDTRLDKAVSDAEEALKANDEAVQKFNAAVADLDGDGNDENFPMILDKAGDWLSSVGAKVDDFLGVDEKPDTEPLPDLGAPTAPSLTTPSAPTESPLGKTDTPKTNSTDPLSSLWDTPTAQTPTSTSSPLGSSPMSGLGSSLGQTPSATPTTEPPSTGMDAAAFDELMGDEPEPLEELDELDELDESEDEDDTAEDESDEDDAAGTEDTEEPVDGIEEEPAPPTDEELTDEELRTVELADGRSIVFPTEQHAAMVREMVAAGTENPTTVYMAADAAGFELPPMGTDIGEPISAMDIQPGDVVVGADGVGVSIGGGEVMMESGEIRPVEEVSRVEDGSHGVFRLEAPTETDPDSTPETPAAAEPAPPAGGETTPAPAPAMGDQQPAPAPVEGDPLDLLVS